MSKWVLGKIGDLIKALESGVSVNGYDRTPLIHEYAVLKVSAVTYGIFDPNAAKPIYEKEIHKARCTPKKGQIIISRSNTPELVGASALIKKDYPYRYLSDKLWQTVPRKETPFNMVWLSYYLSSPRVRFQLSKLATGSSSSMKNITKEEFLNLPISIPPLKEQDFISNILQKWDLAIEKTEALIAAKQKQFEWLAKSLFRSSAHKEYLKRFIKELSKRNKDNKIIQVLSVTNRNGFVLPEDQFERRVASADISNYKIVKKGQYAYNPSRINVGSIARLEDWNEAVLSPMYTIFELNAEELNSNYFLHWLSSNEAKQRIKKSAQGSVRETVSFDDLGNILIPISSIKRQKNIASILNKAKYEISLLKDLAKSYRNQKLGLMHKLLTGKWRIKAKEVA